MINSSNYFDTCFLLVGGSGTRLWPLSTETRPKQFLPLIGGKTLFHHSLMRMLRLFDSHRIFFITSAQLSTILVQEIKNSIQDPVQVQVLSNNVITEPEGRNTAAAVYLGLKTVQTQLSQKDLTHFNKTRVFISPCDSYIPAEQENVYISCIQKSMQSYPSQSLLTFGVKAQSPNVGFGYIEVNQPTDSASNAEGLMPVLRFHEKPNLEQAKQYVKSGRFFWNCGIFFSEAAHLLERFSHYDPTFSEVTWNAEQLTGEALKKLYPRLPKVPFDVAIAEKHPHVRVAPLTSHWNDLGTWSSFQQEHVPTEVLADHSLPHIHQIEAQKNVVISEREVIVIGLSEVAIVENRHQLLVCALSHADKVKEASAYGKQYFTSQKEKLSDDRPWGRYESLETQSTYKVKKIVIFPGQQLSYQSHNHREEHWCVVAGEGVFILEGSERAVSKGQYLHVPLKSKHRLRNTGKTDLVFIEIQVGSQVAETDIVRYQDDYQRV